MNQDELRVQDFDKAHEQPDGWVIVDNHWVLYSDGARRSCKADGPLGTCLVQPSRKPEDLRQWQTRFWELRLEELVNQFEKRKEAAHWAAQDDPHRFEVLTKELKGLQTRVKIARGHLTKLTTIQQGYSQSDVSRAWDLFDRLEEASRESSEAEQRYQVALTGHSSPGNLEKLKHKFDKARAQADKITVLWQEFQPVAAMRIVEQELSKRRQFVRQQQLSKIEI